MQLSSPVICELCKHCSFFLKSTYRTCLILVTTWALQSCRHVVMSSCCHVAMCKNSTWQLPRRQKGVFKHALPSILKLADFGKQQCQLLRHVRFLRVLLNVSIPSIIKSQLLETCLLECVANKERRSLIIMCLGRVS